MIIVPFYKLWLFCKCWAIFEVISKKQYVRSSVCSAQMYKIFVEIGSEKDGRRQIADDRKKSFSAKNLKKDPSLRMTNYATL